MKAEHDTGGALPAYGNDFSVGAFGRQGKSGHESAQTHHTSVLPDPLDGTVEKLAQLVMSICHGNLHTVARVADLLNKWVAHMRRVAP